MLVCFFQTGNDRLLGNGGKDLQIGGEGDEYAVDCFLFYSIFLKLFFFFVFEVKSMVTLEATNNLATKAMITLLAATAMTFK